MNKKQLRAEFDKFADVYYEAHKKNIKITGEGPEYFSRYKIKDFYEFFEGKILPERIMDFGSGIGNSILYFREFFSQSKLTCTDVSTKSIEISKERFPGDEEYIEITNKIPVKDEGYDAVFTACVFHHIPHEEHEKWLEELWRVLRKDGILVIYEHNPINPLTVRAVNTCPLDENAKLIKAGVMKRKLQDAGWREVNVAYKLFFPGFFRSFRWMEKYLTKVFLGAQWRIVAKK